MSAGGAVFEGDLGAASLGLLGESILSGDACWGLARVHGWGSGRFGGSVFALNLGFLGLNKKVAQILCFNKKMIFCLFLCDQVCKMPKLRKISLSYPNTSEKSKVPTDSERTIVG